MFYLLVRYAYNTSRSNRLLLVDIRSVQTDVWTQRDVYGRRETCMDTERDVYGRRERRVWTQRDVYGRRETCMRNPIVLLFFKNVWNGEMSLPLMTSLIFVSSVIVPRCMMMRVSVPYVITPMRVITGLMLNVPTTSWTNWSCLLKSRFQMLPDSSRTKIRSAAWCPHPIWTSLQINCTTNRREMRLYKSGGAWCK